MGILKHGLFITDYTDKKEISAICELNLCLSYSMLTKLNEQVEVLVIFTKKGPKPYALKWGKKKYIIEKINLVYEKKAGDGKLVYFSVTSQNNFFKLVFDTNNLTWHLEEVYSE